jgi:predicted nucleotidyltransferase
MEKYEILDENSIQQIRDRIIKYYQPEKIILFGSYANGTQTKNSDVDFLIIKESKIPRYKRAREVRKILKDFIFPKDIIVLTKAEFERYVDIKGSFAYEVVKSGKVLYG